MIYFPPKTWNSTYSIKLLKSMCKVAVKSKILDSHRIKRKIIRYVICAETDSLIFIFFAFQLPNKIYIIG